jgi:hypothetical protein
VGCKPKVRELNSDNMLTNKKVLLIPIALVLMGIAVLMFILLSKTQLKPHEDILGSWYAWHEMMGDFDEEVLTFHDDGTYNSSLIVFEGIQDKYTIDKNTIYLEGMAFYPNMALERQNGQLVLRADNDLIYYKTAELAQADLAKRKLLKDNAQTQAETGLQKRTSEQEGHLKQEEQVKNDQLYENFLGVWGNNFGVSLAFDRDEYIIVDTEGKYKIGTYRITNSNTMIIFDPDTQAEEETEFTLSKDSKEDADVFTFSSQYFKWAGDFYKYDYGLGF